METRHLRYSLSLSLSIPSPRFPFRNPRSQPSRFFPPLLVSTPVSPLRNLKSAGAWTRSQTKRSIARQMGGMVKGHYVIPEKYPEGYTRFSSFAVESWKSTNVRPRVYTCNDILRIKI